MKNNRIKFLFLSLLVLSITFSLYAADGAAGTVSTKLNWVLALIPVITPLLLAALKWVVPKIPKSLIPILAPIFGAALDIVQHFITGNPTNPVWASVLGMAGVCLREVVDQIKKAAAPPVE